MPNAHGFIIAAADQGLAIGTKGNGFDRSPMTAEDMVSTTGGKMPKLNRFVIAAAGQDLTVGAEGDGFNLGSAAGAIGGVDGAEFLAAGEVPKFDCVVVAAAGKGLAMTTDGDRIHTAAMGIEGIETMPMGFAIAALQGHQRRSGGKGIDLRCDHSHGGYIKG